MINTNPTVYDNTTRTYKYTFSPLALELNWRKMNSKNILRIILLGLAITTGFTVAQLPLQIQDQRSRLTQKTSNIKKTISNSALNEKSFQLPGDLVPTSYKLEVIPVLKNPPTEHKEFTAPGAVEIVVTCKANTKRITLSAVELEIQEVTVVAAGTTDPIKVKTPVPDIDLQFVYIDLESGELESGKDYILTLKYTAPIANGLVGLYRGEYTDANGDQKWFAATQFATVGFRRMAPGFDDPKFKAVFTVSICRPEAQNTLSNTVIDPDATDADVILKNCPTGWKWDHYKPTVVMSSYLLALVVSEYQCVEASDNDFGKPVKVCGPPHWIASPRSGGDFAAAHSHRNLKAYDEIFGINDEDLKYPMYKMDSVAIPRKYFQWGAMENWGIVTYTDERLMYYQGESLEAERYDIASIISHEFAHQWFGDLVTCDWWSHVWLNEGFATYWAAIGVSKTIPEYKSREQFLCEAHQRALLEDAGSISHPVINEGTNDDVISMSIFDVISYQKGGSLLRMMEGFLGEDILFEGLRSYLSNMKYKTAVQNDLFEHLGKVAKSKLPDGVELKEIMDTWTLKRGFPLVRVSVASENKVYISQEAFRNNILTAGKGINKNPDPNELWEIPIAVATEENPNFSNHSAALWLKKNVASTSFSHNTNEWIIINPESYGFYRVLYDTKLTDLIQKQLDSDHKIISPLSKSQLIDDYFSMANQGHIQIESALAMTKFLSTESSQVVWTPALKAFTKFQQLFGSYPQAYNALKGYLAPKLEGALNELKWTQAINEHGVNVILRASLMDWACVLNHPKCNDTANTYFMDFIVKDIEVPVDLQPVVYCSVIAGGDSTYFKALSRMFQNLNHDKDTPPVVLTRLLNGLSCTENVEDLIWLLENVVEGGSKEHASLVLQNRMKHVNNRDSTHEYVRLNWKKLVDKTGSHEIIAEAITAASTYQSSDNDIANHDALVSSIVLADMDLFNKLSPTFMAVTQAIKTNQAWISTNLPIIQKWLQNNTK